MVDPFYIEVDCCLSCGVPESIAPELFGWRNNVCMLRRQPNSPSEIDKMVEAMWSSEADCIRYRGDEPGLLKRLGEAGMSHLADDIRANTFPAQVRDRVTFLPRPSDLRVTSPIGLANAFRAYLRHSDGYKVSRAFLRPRTVSFSWFEHNFHSVIFDKREHGGRQKVMLRAAKKSALQGLARIVDRWLKDECDALEIGWHTKAGLTAGEAGYPLPF